VFQACLQQADILKAEGNDHFRSKRWDQALVAYHTGLSRLPAKVQSEELSDQDELKEGLAAGTLDDHNAFSPSDCATRRAVLNANIAACYVKLVTTNILCYRLLLTFVNEGDHKNAVDACTAGQYLRTYPLLEHMIIFHQALRDDPKYVKALQRRAVSNEAINSWTSLSAARDGMILWYCAVVSLTDYQSTFQQITLLF
jgi:hypothetical protein